VLATWVICSQNRHLQLDLTSPLLAEKREMSVQSTMFALPHALTPTHFQEGEVHPLSRVFISIKHLVCSCFHILQDGFLRWTRPLNTSLLLGALADLARGKSELVAEKRSYANNSSSFVDRANDQCAARGIASCWCFWQRPFEPGGKPS